MPSLNQIAFEALEVTEIAIQVTVPLTANAALAYIIAWLSFANRCNAKLAHVGDMKVQRYSADT